MKTTLLVTWPLFLGLGMIVLGNGLQGTLLGLRATLEGFPVVATGIIMTCYYIGYLLGSIIVPKLVGQVGHIRVFAALASMASTTILLHAIAINPIPWAIVRIATGFSYAGLYIVVESWLNDRATNKNRGQLMSLYMVIANMGLALGQGLLNLGDPQDFQLFVLVSVLVSLALVPISLSKNPAPEFTIPETISLKRIYIISPLGLIGVVISGFSSSSIISIGPVYAGESGLSIAEISMFMGAFLLGGMFTQFPLGLLSDKFDRRNIILLCAAASCVCGILCFIIGATGLVTPLIFMMFALGGFCLPLYGLSISHANDHIQKKHVVAASGTLILANAAGACLGPLTTTALIGGFGVQSFFALQIILFLGLSAFCVYRIVMRPSVPLEDQQDYVPYPSRGSPMYAQLIDDAGE